MNYKYVGPHDAVDLVGVGTVEQGHEVEVSGDVARSLDSQSDWQRVNPKPRQPKNEE
jgi:hypothetical protein